MCWPHCNVWKLTDTLSELRFQIVEALVEYKSWISCYPHEVKNSTKIIYHNRMNFHLLTLKLISLGISNKRKQWLSKLCCLAVVLLGQNVNDIFWKLFSGHWKGSSVIWSIKYLYRSYVVHLMLPRSPKNQS